MVAYYPLQKQKTQRFGVAVVRDATVQGTGGCSGPVGVVDRWAQWTMLKLVGDRCHHRYLSCHGTTHVKVILSI